MSRKWTAVEITVMVSEYNRTPLSELAKKLGRTEGAIKAKAVGYGIGMPSVEFDCAHCGRHIVTKTIKKNGRPDMRRRFCCTECEKKYWRHPPEDRQSSRQNFRSIRECEAWEKFTNG